MRSLYRMFFSPAPESYRAHALYIALAREARNPFFYREAQVPDTLDGRFDMQVLLLFLALERLKEMQAEPAFAQALLECFFSELDRALREMGVGDLGVGRRVKAMANACNGRLTRYRNDWSDPQSRAAALTENLYRGDHTRANAGIPHLLVALEALSLRLTQVSAEQLGEGVF